MTIQSRHTHLSGLKPCRIPCPYCKVLQSLHLEGNYVSCSARGYKRSSCTKLRDR